MSGVAPAAFTCEKPTAWKDALVTMLWQSFEYCAPVVADIRDATLGETIKVGRNETANRALVLLDLVSGMDHHYGQAAACLRLNGLVPPTAAPAKNGRAQQ